METRIQRIGILNQKNWNLESRKLKPVIKTIGMGIKKIESRELEFGIKRIGIWNQENLYLETRESKFEIKRIGIGNQEN